MLIYGHVRDCVVVAGQKVKAGQLIGYSGGFNGDHLHLEYRTSDSSTGSGWRIVDPRLTPLNGQRIPVSTSRESPTPTATATEEVPVEVTEEVTEEPTDEVTPETVTAATETETAPADDVTPTQTPSGDEIVDPPVEETPVPRDAARRLVTQQGEMHV